MKEYRNRFSVTKMATALGVSTSGYYAWESREPSRHDEEDRILAELIKKIFKEHHGRYGSPRVWHEVKSQGWRISRKRVERIMREQGLASCRRQKWTKTTHSNHKLPISENILGQNFKAAFPGEKWVSDITYLLTESGWLYLTVVIDLWDRKVIGWSIAEDLTAKHVCLALAMAFCNRPPREGLIFHSDRGIQYCSEEFRNTLFRLCPTVRQSMSRKANCWDNACAESFFKTLKAEVEELKRRCSKRQIRTSVFEYIEAYYNRRRRHSALGYAIPIALAPNDAA